jgi:murein DD-endopeptidase MepM/ murein hydrolase activator NlpD
MARRNVVQSITYYAKKHGVDPRAALAVAMTEGGLKLGAVGDKGTSFGPFQLHVGGALPRGKGAAWANSPAGIEYAVRQMAQAGARGLQGRAAVNAIVQNFERPARPGAEISKAMNLYGSTQPMSGAPSQPIRDASAPLSGDANKFFARALLRASSRGNYSDLINAAMHVRDMRAQQPDQKAEPTTTDAAEMSPGARPAPGKIIGTPGQGTHTLGNWESDNAVDVSMPEGTPLYAVANGVIGPQFGSLGEGGRFAGLRLHLKSKGNEWYYAHLSKFAPGLKPGTRVKKGQLLGYSGSANGVAHLHLGQRAGDPRDMYG